MEAAFLDLQDPTMRPTFDPRALYHFHVMSESGSMSAASELLGVSQPTLSRTVSTLETQVGRQLMIRGRNGVILTEAGLMLAEQGRQIASDLRGADDILLQLKTNNPPTIRIGAGPLISLVAINDFLTDEIGSAVRNTYHLKIAPARQLITDLLHNRLDIAVMATPADIRIEHLKHKPIIDDNIGLFTGADSPLFQMNHAPNLEDLSQAKWVTIEASFGPQSSHDNMLRHFGLPSITPAVHYDMNIHGMLNALVDAHALCFLPSRITNVLAKTNALREIQLGTTSEIRQISIWHAADADLNTDVADTIRKARSFVHNRLTKKLS